MDKVILVAIGAFVYLFPTLFAVSRGRRNAGAVLVLNVFLGWTGVGWVGALVWAAVNDRRG